MMAFELDDVSEGEPSYCPLKSVYVVRHLCQPVVGLCAPALVRKAYNINHNSLISSSLKWKLICKGPRRYSGGVLYKRNWFWKRDYSQRSSLISQFLIFMVPFFSKFRCILKARSHSCGSWATLRRKQSANAIS